MSEEHIKRLAQESLENKWYPIKNSVLDEEEQIFDVWHCSCDFCEDVNGHCFNCVIGDNSPTALLICKAIDKAYEIDDYCIIIEALEELAEFGYLSGDMMNRLVNYEEI